jgi:hypothetical protein
MIRCRCRCKCKKSYSSLITSYKKGEWYLYGENDWGDEDIFYVYDNDPGYSGFYKKEFKEHFLTEQEVREMEINKILLEL